MANKAPINTNHTSHLTRALRDLNLFPICPHSNIPHQGHSVHQTKPDNEKAAPTHNSPPGVSPSNQPMAYQRHRLRRHRGCALNSLAAQRPDQLPRRPPAPFQLPRLHPSSPPYPTPDLTYLHRRLRHPHRAKQEPVPLRLRLHRPRHHWRRV